MRGGGGIWEECEEVHLRHMGLGKCWWGLNAMGKRSLGPVLILQFACYAKRLLYVIFVLENMGMSCLLFVFLLSIIATVDIN